MHNNNDTILFYGTGKKKLITTEKGNLGACGPTTIQHNDNYKYSFVSDDVVDKINIEIRFPNYLDFFIKGNRFVSHLGDLRDPYDLSQILINNYEYKNIIIIRGSQLGDSIYYSVVFGIIKLSFQNGDQWTLLK